LRVDRFGAVLEQQLDPGPLELDAVAVGERTPVGDLAGEEVRQPAD
jgi:hypothetical protein